MEAEAARMEEHSSAAAFVEGGVQDACDDACSICLEAFSDSDPSAVTSCKHEFHLQCILEWCQRSSQCPMCWQAISMKDPMSQELLEAVVEERNMQENHARTTTIFRHPLLGDFEVALNRHCYPWLDTTAAALISTTTMTLQPPPAASTYAHNACPSMFIHGRPEASTTSLQCSPTMNVLQPSVFLL